MRLLRVMLKSWSHKSDFVCLFTVYWSQCLLLVQISIFFSRKIHGYPLCSCLKFENTFFIVTFSLLGICISFFNKSLFFPFSISNSLFHLILISFKKIQFLVSLDPYSDWFSFYTFLCVHEKISFYLHTCITRRWIFLCTFLTNDLQLQLLLE